MKPADGFLVIGHRGARGPAPENTLAAFRYALAAGVRMVEFDIQASCDGRLFVMHDDTVDRTTNGTGVLCRLPSRTLRTFKGQDGLPIPELREVLSLIKGRCRANVEFKSRGAAQCAVTFFRRKSLRGLLFSSFDWTELTTFRAARPDAALGVLFKHERLDKVFTAAHRLKALSVHPPASRLSADLVGRATREGLDVYVWGIRNTDDMKRCLTLKTQGFFADDPKEALEFVSRTGLKNR